MENTELIEAGLEPGEPNEEREVLATTVPATVPVQELLPEPEAAMDQTDAQIRAILEAIIYITDEPLTADQIAAALNQPRNRVEACLAEIAAEFAKPEHGLSIQQVAGGFKMSTKAEHHERVRAFVRSLKPPLKLSLAALETLAMIAYKQPITAPEIMEVRGVQGASVLKTLLDRKLIAAAGRKNVVGKPILYKTTREFLVQFGLNDLAELPSLKEFHELRRMAVSDDAPTDALTDAPAESAAETDTPPEAPTPESGGE